VPDGPDGIAIEKAPACHPETRFARILAEPIPSPVRLLIGPDLLSSLTVTGLTRDTIGLLSCGRLCSPGSVYLASRHFCTLEMGWSVREQVGKPVGL
jgi:hypothetical protein